MSITIRAVGQAGRRGATRRVPNAVALLSAIDEWLPDGTAGALQGHVLGTRAADGAIEIGLHPAARPVRIEATDTGQVVASAMTVPVGPGYHTYIASLLDRHHAKRVNIAVASELLDLRAGQHFGHLQLPGFDE